MILTSKKISISLKGIFLVILLSPLNALADRVPGTCWSASAPTMNKGRTPKFKNMKKGETDMKYMNAYGEFGCTAIGDSDNRYNIYAKANMTLPPSDINPGYYTLNKDLDISIIIEQEKNPSGMAPPFIDIYTGYSLELVSAPDYIYGIKEGIARVTYKLRRDITTGVLAIPPYVKIASIYYAPREVGNTSPIKYSEPTFYFKTGSHIIIGDRACKINNDDIINVNFGDINSALLYSGDIFYSKKIPLNISCNRYIGENVAIQLIADASEFSDNLIKTNKKNLGIMIKNRNNIIKPWALIPVTMNGNNANIEIEASLVNNNGLKPETGDFSSSATLILSLP